MSISAHWYVTNITHDAIRLIHAYIVKPRTNSGAILIKPRGSYEFGNHQVPPGETLEAIAHFWVQPPAREEYTDFKTTVVIIDQFGNEHRLRNMVFEHPPRPKSVEEPTSEALHTMTDPVEKQVAAVLKAEVTRYRSCGRRVGGLGSVETFYMNRTFTGIGSDVRLADSPKNQSIVVDCSEARITSDNAGALINLYHSLTSDSERSGFITALLKRLSRDTEYAPVGYLILLVLFRIGHLREALNTAKRELQKDRAYGFSDLLRLLDGLLRFDHSSFADDQLDQIEEFLNGVEEHSFGINERLVSIRAHRLAALTISTPITASPAKHETTSHNGNDSTIPSDTSASS